jgi:hypothetical protein
MNARSKKANPMKTYEQRMSRRKRKKMAKIQQRKILNGSKPAANTQNNIYRHLINSEISLKVRAYLNKGFEENLFLASLRNLSDIGNPLRFNNFAYAIREIISILLHRLSSDEDIIKCSWYQN